MCITKKYIQLSNFTSTMVDVITIIYRKDIIYKQCDKVNDSLQLFSETNTLALQIDSSYNKNINISLPSIPFNNCRTKWHYVPVFLVGAGTAWHVNDTIERCYKTLWQFVPTNHCITARHVITIRFSQWTTKGSLRLFEIY